MNGTISDTLSLILGAYSASVIACWIVRNRLKEGILFQKQVYVSATFVILGTAFSHIVLFGFPNAGIAASFFGAIGVAAGTWYLHKELLCRVKASKRWNVAIFSISAALFAVVSFLNLSLHFDIGS